ncbi:MAG TPA: hypothetical protein VK554_13460 [Bradyrhizobium sp.]|nr:hypothetical protein [Bradyrhizobium sp.]
MEWVKERDLLIAQTMAFVQSVNDRKLGARRLDAKRWAESRIEAAPIDATKPIDAIKPIEAIKIVEQPPANIPFNVPAARPSVPAARPSVSGEVRAEMQNRVASFRAHQQRFHRERDEYCSATLAKMRVLVSDDSASAPLRE